ncbi:hypothetical protein [Leptothrix discophora]|uniref:Uncharacterized protein n=1 Tax=Leptothrix discophora TaxID=89 RepID=A0ABT9G0C9_LEPDI|nr:hypothetical protein [Leptothrix discophora]MDP4299935.1 hypothetical protein [Leptothrix discophora]
MTKTIYLHGPLAERYGHEPFTFKANNARDLFSGLKIICPGFLNELRRYSSLAIIKRDGDRVEGVRQDEYTLNFGQWQELHVIAGVTAAGGEAFAAWAVSAFGATGTTATFVSFAAQAVYAIAVSYAVSAVIQSFQSTPTTEKAKATNESSLFDGPANNKQPGSRVQLNYGVFRVGSVTVNQKMTAIRQALAANDTVSLLESTTKVINIFTNDLFTTAPTVTNFVINGTTTAAGATYTSGGRSYTLLANGQLTIVAGAGAATTTITVNATDSGNPINQTVTVTITAKRYEDYRSSGSSTRSTGVDYTGGSSTGNSGSGWDSGSDTSGYGSGTA